MTVVLGTVWCFMKNIEAPYVFDLETGIALHPMQVIWGSSPTEGDVSWDFLVAAGTWGIFLSYSGDGHLKLHLVQRIPDSCLVRTDTSGS